MSLKIKTKQSMNKYLDTLRLIKQADAIVIGAGSGLSTAAGFEYDGPRFDKYFFDFKEKYGIQDMYSGGFYQYPTQEEYWAFWSRVIWINRYAPAPKDTYRRLLDLARDKNYFVITTNVDHQFQKAGFAKKRLFYTQGDYGLFQSSYPNDKNTYDNYELVRQMILAQGFTIKKDGNLRVPDANLKMKIPTSLVPKINNLPVKLNLRVDDTFVEDKGWHQALKEYQKFLKENMAKNVLYLELGVGMNTPVIIKYPFWQLTIQNPLAHYVSVNQGHVWVADQIVNRSITFSEDINCFLQKLKDEG